MATAVPESDNENENENENWSAIHDNSKFERISLSTSIIFSAQPADDIPADRVRRILTKPVVVPNAQPGSSNNENDQQPTFTRTVFCQMDILCHFSDGSKGWKEAARWIKYEEAVDNAGRWSNPYMPVAFLRSILDMRRCIVDGTATVNLFLNCPQGDDARSELADLISSALQQERGLSDDQASQLYLALISTHKHAHRGRLPDHDGCCDKCLTALTRCRKALPHRKPRQYRHNEYPVGMTPTDLKSYKPNKELMKKLPSNTEVASILVGQLPFIQQPLIGFFRLHWATILSEMTEVDLPTRFVFIFIGSMTLPIQEMEGFGRAMAILLTDKIFNEVAYRAETRYQLLDGIDEYIDQLVVLPPSIWDPAARMSPPEQSRSLDKVQERLEIFSLYLEKNIFTPDGALADETLKRTGRPFGGLINDVKRKARLYLSDLRDALHYQSLATVLFLFFACLTPLVTFGGLMGEDTDNYLGTIEAIIAGAISGIIFHLFAGQPLITIGAVGPVLVFEIILYKFSEQLEVEFLSFRFWVGFWMSVILYILVAFDLSFLMRYVTRFTEESFTILNALIYIGEAFAKLIDSWHIYPVHIGPYRRSDEYGCHCYPPMNSNEDDGNYSTILLPPSEQNNTTVSPNNDINQTLPWLTNEIKSHLVINNNVRWPLNELFNHSSNQSWSFGNWSSVVEHDCITGDESIIVNFRCINEEECLQRGWLLNGTACYVGNVTRAVPDVFFLCWILALGTFALAVALKHFRNSTFFPSIVRKIIGDFAVFEAIICFTLLDYYFGIETPKLVLPDSIKPTRTDRSFIVNPFGFTAVWVIPIALIPGALGVILLFLDQQITALIVNRPEHKLQKGGGYHLDLMVIASIIMLCSLLGLPWYVASPVRSLMHVRSLMKESEIRIPGEHPKLIGIREQRVTGLVIHLLIALSAFFTGILRHIPMPVLYGVFIYMGYSSLHGVQFIERILLMFHPKKYQKDFEFLKYVKIKRVHIFTGIQILCMVILWTVKSIDHIALAFPFVLLGLCFVRKGLTLIYDVTELYWLDGLLPNEISGKKNKKDLLQAWEKIAEEKRAEENSREQLQASGYNSTNSFDDEKNAAGPSKMSQANSINNNIALLQQMNENSLIRKQPGEELQRLRRQPENGKIKNSRTSQL